MEQARLRGSDPDELSRLQVRSATPADLPVLIAIEQACFPDPWATRSLQDALTDEHTVVLLAEYKGIPVGCALAWIVGDEAEIARLAIYEEVRGQGFGSQLLRALLEECARRGANRIFLEVRLSNHAARRLYERGGFVQVGLRRKYYQDGEDAIIMRLENAASC